MTNLSQWMRNAQNLGSQLLRGKSSAPKKLLQTIDETLCCKSIQGVGLVAKHSTNRNPTCGVRALICVPNPPQVANFEMELAAHAATAEAPAPANPKPKQLTQLSMLAFVKN